MVVGLGVCPIVPWTIVDVFGQQLSLVLVLELSMHVLKSHMFCNLVVSISCI